VGRSRLLIMKRQPGQPGRLGRGRPADTAFGGHRGATSG
jgi:hypothetical protein